jgi:hypothetical protein
MTEFTSGASYTSFMRRSEAANIAKLPELLKADGT